MCGMCVLAATPRNVAVRGAAPCHTLRYAIRALRRYDASMPSLRTLEGAIVWLLALAGCTHHAEVPRGPDTLVVAPETTALAVGESARLTATFEKDGTELAA